MREHDHGMGHGWGEEEVMGEREVLEVREKGISEYEHDGSVFIS